MNRDSIAGLLGICIASGFWSFANSFSDDAVGGDDYNAQCVSAITHPYCEKRGVGPCTDTYDKCKILPGHPTPLRCTDNVDDNPGCTESQQGCVQRNDAVSNDDPACSGLEGDPE